MHLYLGNYSAYIWVIIQLKGPPLSLLNHENQFKVVVGNKTIQKLAEPETIIKVVNLGHMF